METAKASDVLADRIRRSILDGTFEEGTVLPTERRLMEQTRLGRSTVREALRMLQAEGLVSSRPGRKGGTVVRRPDVQGIAQSLEVFIRGRRIRFWSLLEAREALEPGCASLAATNRTDADLEVLDALDARMNEPGIARADYFAANVGWHVAVARASHNELLTAYMVAISNVIEDALFAAQTDSEAVRPAVLLAHRKILEAIHASDPEAARRRMYRHMHAYREQAARLQPPAELPLSEGR
ncbi:MAG: FCD domain-containing protein [Streptosporangiales bacterium]|nr:FCD domain-containing protein [Streptosporangiales bacterium]